MFTIRNDSFDERIYNEVYVNNGYNIRDDLSEYIVIDIGAHIGSFIKLVVENKAKFVEGYELFPESYEQCKQNTSNYENVKIYNNAVWRSDINIENISISKSKLYSLVNGKHILNTGGETLLSEINNKDIINVPAITLDNIIDKNLNQFNKIDLIKIDCEGSEYPIIYTSKKLNLVNNIVIEYHYYDFSFRPEALVKDRKYYNEKSLSKHLEEQGFIIFIDKPIYMTNEIYHGNLYAVKDLNNNPFLIDYLKNGRKYGIN